ncbi:molybdopterin-dependent oxidoreductase [Nocardia sp. NPDC004860]|uniref:molybdopterin-dependent oxidoreductase n=1 Tax=Nocardia sp. NPDC004860 TaxID=3154557 RepID=UPI0033A8085C
MRTPGASRWRQARRSDVLVALRMQDAPITHEHGGPVRLYVAPMYFYKSAKWLSGISVTSRYPLWLVEDQPTRDRSPELRN